MSEIEIDRIIEMAWEDRAPFEAIKLQFGKNESDVIKIMRKNLKPSSFKLWRKRVQGRKTKHKNKIMNDENLDIKRFKCKMQRQITNNKISKR